MSVNHPKTKEGLPVHEVKEGFYLSEEGEWIPDGWNGATLGENCYNISTGPFGSSLHAADYVAEGIPSIMPQNIINGRISEDGIARITEFDANRLKRHRVRVGDIVFSRRGDIEKCALISDREQGWLCGTGCLQIQFENPKISKQFVFFQLSSPQTAKWLYSNCVGATMPNLNTRILKRLPLLLPPLPEQKAIAAVLGSLDDKIELLREQNETLENLAQTLFKRWFIDFNFPDKKGKPYKDNGGNMIPSELGEIPKGWRVGSLRDTIDLNKKSWSAKKHPSRVEYVDLANTKNGMIQKSYSYLYEDAPSRAKRILSKYDTIIGTVRPGNRSYALIGIDDKYTGSTGFAVCSPKLHSYKEHNYVALTLNESFNRLEFLADGSAYPAVNPDVVISEVRPIATNIVFQQFSELTFSNLEKTIYNLEQIQNLTLLRDTLLPKLMKGEIRINGE